MGLKPGFTNHNKQTNKQKQKHIALKIIANPNLASRMRDFTFRQCGIAQTLTAQLNTTIVVQPLSCVRLFATPWTAACQPSLSFTISQSLLKLMSIESVMPSNHLILCCTHAMLEITQKASNGKLKVGKEEVNWLESSRLEIILQSLTQYKMSV